MGLSLALETLKKTVKYVAAAFSCGFAFKNRRCCGRLHGGGIRPLRIVRRTEMTGSLLLHSGQTLFPCYLMAPGQVSVLSIKDPALRYDLGKGSFGVILGLPSSRPGGQELGDERI
jgi:hypothetical protein